ncbi:cell division topological specificity factor MinE [Buchnera aphidicola]|uniref:Cell division topological specificity factor n=1 Tax=Buchnera aphidicola (Anoecia oenotherae) TaxID=1241833 RepID=A0A4D6Y0K5_9GAMM|nr:cell division topological specificity factor MinE [Buchnera aphidicola]QCI19381.1 cell division topological specificity factor MinE [Buchnera aphidicola (Anoecia oenotherae)]
MSLLNFFFSRKKKKTAKIAKNRLKIIIEEERKNKKLNHYLPQIKLDIIKVICKYIKLDPKTTNIQIEYKENKISILELNITFIEQ